MKFLCEHCKAKYQIADEKVAGRTVRMKCRKCGNLIEVRAAVTETSVNAKVPTEPPPAAPAAHEGQAHEGTKGPRPAPGRSLATSLSNAPKPAPTRPGAPRSQESGTLAGAFHRNVQREEEISVALDLRELSAADEWYVAINGVPVGPIRVAELRRKAAIGVVTEESLCWQEGMEEWRPVRAVAELAALVREAALGGRVSLVTPPPPESRPSPSGPPPRAGSQRPAVGGGPLAPRPQRPASPFSNPLSSPSGGPGASGAAPTAVAARSNVVPFTSRLATAERLHEEDPRPEPKSEMAAIPMIAADPFGGPVASPVKPDPGASSNAGLVGPPPAPAGEPFGASLMSEASVPAPALVAAGIPEKKPPPFIAIAMIVLAGAFGITAAVMVFTRPAPQIVVQAPAAAPQPQAAVPTPAAATSSAPSGASGNNDTPATAPAPSASGGTTKVASAGPKSGGGKTTAAGATDPGIKDLINNLNGPAPGIGDPGGGGAGAQLTSDQVQSVMAIHQLAVKRNCWERIQTQSPSVNEMVQIVVGPGGQVTSATATGNDGVVGHCIEGEVRRWTFPGSGTVNIPFHFLRQ